MRQLITWLLLGVALFIPNLWTVLFKVYQAQSNSYGLDLLLNGITSWIHLIFVLVAGLLISCRFNVLGPDGLSSGVL